MAKRKVEVELILDAHNYLDETAKAAAATKALEAETEHLGSASDHTGTDLSEMAKNTDRAKDSVTGLGRNMHDTGEALRLLDARIAQTKLSVRDLGVEFATTGDAAAGQQLGSERSLLGKLTSLRKEVAAAHEELKKLASLDAPFHLGDMGNGRSGIRKWISHISSAVGDAAAAGVKIGSSIVSGIGYGFSQIGAVALPILITSLISAALMAAPMLGAIIGGAVAGGVGTLGVAAGIVAASRDPRVGVALSDLGYRVEQEFFAAGAAFVEPVMNSIGVLNHALDDINFGDTMKKAAPYVEIIVTGLADLLRNIMPGLNRTMGRLGPFADVAAQGFSDLGRALGSFLDDVTGSPGAVAGLETAFRILSGTIILLGKGINALGDAYDWVLEKGYAAAVALSVVADAAGFDGYAEDARALAGLAAELRDVPGSAGPADKSFSRFADTLANMGFDPFIGYLVEARTRIKELDSSMSELMSNNMSTDQAMLQWAQDILTLTEATKEHGTSLKVNTQAGIDNRRMIMGMIQDAQAIREATYKQTGSVDVANAAYQRQIDVLKENLRHLHYTEDQIKEMVGEYEVNVNVNLNYKESGAYPQSKKNLDLGDYLETGRHRAHGGPVGPGAYLVGDGGKPEILQMGAGQNGYVYPSVQSWQSANDPSGGWQAASGSTGGGNRTITVIVQDTSGRTLKTQLIDDALGRGVPSTTIAAAYP